jgi:hypothetical protein
MMMTSVPVPVPVSINYADFSVFADLYNDTGEKWEAQDCDDALKDYYDAYCTYLVSRKYTTDVIKTYRKNAIVDFYITEKKFDQSVRKDLDTYYIQNIKDSFHKTLDPPPCFFHEVRMEQKRDQIDIDTDDVAQHYINMKNRYKALYKEMTNVATTANNPSNMNGCELQSDCDDIESNYDYYDEYYNMYDSDYYSENDYYSDGYSDDYDLHD